MNAKDKAREPWFPELTNQELESYPEDKVDLVLENANLFLQGISDSITEIEAKAFQLLQILVPIFTVCAGYVALTPKRTLLDSSEVLASGVSAVSAVIGFGSIIWLLAEKCIRPRDLCLAGNEPCKLIDRAALVVDVITFKRGLAMQAQDSITANLDRMTAAAEAFNRAVVGIILTISVSLALYLLVWWTFEASWHRPVAQSSHLPAYTASAPELARAQGQE